MSAHFRLRRSAAQRPRAAGAGREREPRGFRGRSEGERIVVRVGASDRVVVGRSLGCGRHRCAREHGLVVDIRDDDREALRDRCRSVGDAEHDVVTADLRLRWCAGQCSRAVRAGGESEPRRLRRRGHRARVGAVGVGCRDRIGIRDALGRRRRRELVNVGALLTCVTAIVKLCGTSAPVPSETLSCTLFAPPWPAQECPITLRCRSRRE